MFAVKTRELLVHVTWQRYVDFQYRENITTILDYFQAKWFWRQIYVLIHFLEIYLKPKSYFLWIIAKFSNK